MVGKEVIKEQGVRSGWVNLLLFLFHWVLFKVFFNCLDAFIEQLKLASDLSDLLGYLGINLRYSH